MGTSQEIIKEDWFGCYGKPWPKGSITPETFQHPAKFSRALIRRIYRHLLDENLISPGDTILDPFGGAGLGSLDALANGLNWTGNELEQKFVDMGAGCECTGISKADWIRFYGRWERANWKAGRHWCPRCLSEARQVNPPVSSQLALFGSAAPSTSYTRNSGRIPHTDPHHYTGNLELFSRYAKGGATARLAQGDSRHLSRVLRGVGLVSSPPYADQSTRNGGALTGWEGKRRIGASQNCNEGYGGAPGQLGAMPEGQFDALISSSPYANSVNQSDGANDTEARIERMKKAGVDVTNRANVGGGNGVARQPQAYGQTNGQLGAMPEGCYPNPETRNPVPAALVSSPMFAGNSGGRGDASREGIDAALFDRHSGGMIGGLEGSEGNIGGLPMRGFEAVVSSPVYIEGLGHDSGHPRLDQTEDTRRKTEGSNRRNGYGSTNGQLGAMAEGYAGLETSPAYEDTHIANINTGRIGDSSLPVWKQTDGDNYGKAKGQLGQESGETFWSAARTILSESYLALAPGAVAAWVAKDFIKDGQRKPFCAQWRMLCEAVGFEYMYTIRAWQVDRKGKQGKLEGGEVELKREFKSFFRRLHESKPGAKRIDWEEVIFLRKPL